MVHSEMCGAQTTIDVLARAHLDAEVVDRGLIPLGPVLRSRLPWLRHQGLMKYTEQDKEELVVIRARQN